MKRLLIPSLALSIVTASCGKSLQQQCVDSDIGEGKYVAALGGGLRWVSKEEREKLLLSEAVRYCSGGN